MLSFEDLFQQSVALHGHECPGQVIGVRMAISGCCLVGIEEPTTSRDLMVYVEIDRCMADAIQSVTGRKLGKRTLKYLDYGKVAATFVNLRTGVAYRVVALDESRDLAWKYAPPGTGNKLAQLRAYQVMPATELFKVMQVHVDVPDIDMPGPSKHRVRCEQCGEGINDHREVVREGRTLCKPCAGDSYYVTSSPERSLQEVAQ